MNTEEILNALENSSLPLAEKQIKEAIGIALKNPKGFFEIPGLPRIAFKLEAKLELSPKQDELEEVEELPVVKAKKGK